LSWRFASLSFISCHLSIVSLHRQPTFYLFFSFFLSSFFLSFSLSLFYFISFLLLLPLEVPLSFLTFLLEAEEKVFLFTCFFSPLHSCLREALPCLFFEGEIDQHRISSLLFLLPSFYLSFFLHFSLHSERGLLYVHFR
ncbi:hypothetical protein CSUI_005745, partial [Cystoisospora suis]